ncbi:hypothetical protein GCM10010259_11500 [Streptomyces daghestanicus]|nr:hypothetical protein GCM10010240_27290 [Streptomyces griseoviridis]GGU22675.1 hypothetical protein GCM10010259_11500 [Streptomyces daghestanicus]GHI31293.1 hypothetical protein Sdagh_30230 [Streptomyces daghestanicus]
MWGDVSERRGSRESHGSRRPYAPGMSTADASRYVRIRAELVLEVEDAEAITRAALRRIAEDPGLPEAERTGARGAVTEDTAEALAHLVDPFDLVSEVPGVGLQQATWSGERIAYDPDSPDWGLDEDDEDDGDLDDAYDGPHGRHGPHGPDRRVDEDGAEMTVG